MGRGGGGLPVLEVESELGAEAGRAGGCRRWPEPPESAAKAHVQHGDPAESIAAADVELGADLIVVGTRGPDPCRLRCSAASRTV